MKRIVVLFASSIVGLAVIAAGVSWHRSFFEWLPKIAETQERPSGHREIALVVTEEKRKVYPYSIVPGGARSVEEARRAMSNPAVRNHYAAVDLKNLRQATLTADISGYVSYRFGDSIYWTSKKLVLKAGETVYTDGDHVVRGRCLNRISPLPMMPIQPNAPPEKTFNTPVEVPLIALTFPAIPLPPPPTLPIPPAELTPVVPILPTTSSPPGGRKFFPIIPIIPIIPPIHRRSHPPPVTPLVPVVPPPVTVVTPEPEYRWPLVGTLLGLVLAGRIRIRRKARDGAGARAVR